MSQKDETYFPRLMNRETARKYLGVNSQDFSSLMSMGAIKALYIGGRRKTPLYGKEMLNNVEHRILEVNSQIGEQL